MAALLFAGLRVAFATGDDPGFITYQGRLTDTVGTPLTGSYDFRFSVYLEATSGEPLWLEEHPAVAVEDGFYRADLGKATPINREAFGSGALFLAVEVRRSGQDAYDALDPRVAMGHVPFAYNARMLDGEGADYYLNAANLAGALADARLSANVTLQGNAVNGPNQLARLDGSGALPAVSGANLTGLNYLPLAGGTLAGPVTFASGQVFAGSGSELTNLNPANITAGAFTGTFEGDGSGLASVDAATLGGNSAESFRDASNLNVGAVADALLSANVTLAGNAFNGPSQLLQLDGAGALPALDGSALTNLPGGGGTPGGVPAGGIVYAS
ncbi:MAG: hypothetical protein HY719_12840, partial [Planctomycetes bacterium]|nr:hypothetical protein [Planctomycetota bacterium]